MDGSPKVLRVIGAGAVAISGYIHAQLYFDQGYRSIDVDRFFGINLSRSFVLQFISAAVIALALVASVRWERLALPSAFAGAAFSIASLVAYALARTNGLLGFAESRWTSEAKVAVTAEVVGAVVLVGAIVLGRLRRPREAI